MKQLLKAVDSRNRELDVSDYPSYINYYDAPSSSDLIPVPDQAVYVKIVARSAEVWYKFGSEESAYFTEPSADVNNGKAPALLPAGESVSFKLLTETHFCLSSSDGVSVQFWRQ